MKHIFLGCLLFGLMACSNSDKGPDNTLGVERSTEALVISDAKKEKIKKICEAVDYKSNYLLSSDPVYTMSYAQKECEDEGMGSSKDYSVTVEYLNGKYVFVNSDESHFPLPDVQTTTTGIISHLCKGVTTHPILIGGGHYLYIEPAEVSPTDCYVQEGEICLVLEIGTGEEGRSVKINKNESFVFHTKGNKKGFYKKRKITSQ